VLANRKRKAMSKMIFHRLIEHAKRDGVDFANADKVRWIKRLNDDDALLMAKANVVANRKVTRQIRVVQIEHEERRLFAFLGMRLIEAPTEGLAYTELTPGLFGIIVTQADIKPVATGSEIRDAIELQYDGADDFDGFDLKSISDLFPPIFVYEADKDFEYTGDKIRVLGAMVARSYEDGPIEFSDELLKKICDTFQTASEYIPYENILQGMLAISWGGFFVELYRSVEQLYSVPKLEALTSEWKSEMPHKELASLLDRILTWRPREQDSLEALINECSTPTKERLRQAFCPTLEAEKEMGAEAIAKGIYGLRNSLVHFRTGLPAADRSDESWALAIDSMIDVVTGMYDKFGAVFYGGVPA
jgi:hypothetical protein